MMYYTLPTIMSNGMIYKNTCYSTTEQIVNTKKVGFLFSNMNIAFNIHFKQHTSPLPLHTIDYLYHKKYMFLYRIIDRIEIIGYFVFFPFDMYI